MIYHMVLFRVRADVSDERVRAVFAELAGLKDKIDGILSFAGGPYSSDEGVNQGFNHGFCMTFDSAASRDAYLPHPEHEAVKENIIPRIDGVIAFDYEC